MRNLVDSTVTADYIFVHGMLVSGNCYQTAITYQDKGKNGVERKSSQLPFCVTNIELVFVIMKQFMDFRHFMLRGKIK